uniref:Uncharacterized protein n=1 Tax=Sphaerodactylus townsendi TaxID=933632 RepID=A0ACB8EGA1_9SAUR
MPGIEPVAFFMKCRSPANIATTILLQSLYISLIMQASDRTGTRTLHDAVKGLNKVPKNFEGPDSSLIFVYILKNEALMCLVCPLPKQSASQQETFISKT